MDEDGLTVVLTPVQLAAVLNGHPISDGEILSNRIWGGLKVVGGAFEMLGSAALLVAPEPTMATKLGGVALGVHGSDTMSAGVRQVWSGQQTRTFTEQGGAAAARRAGASARTAEAVGTAIDVAVPLAVSIGVAAARVAAIRTTGRISLVEHEAAAGSRLGGHTIAKHVGRTEPQLRARLISEARIPVASSFTSLDVAERVLYSALRSNRTAIAAWARSAAPNARYVIDFAAGEEIGYGVVRATGRLEKLTKVRLVLKLQFYNGKPYFILTSFPTP